jgi:hypothetical protein
LNKNEGDHRKWLVTNHLTKTQTSKEILNDYMIDMEKLGEEYQSACADDHAEDYYVFFSGPPDGQTRNARLPSIMDLVPAAEWVSRK